MRRSLPDGPATRLSSDPAATPPTQRGRRRAEEVDRRRPLVVLGLVGPTLDAGQGSKRWERWRPTVAVCQHEDLLVDRFELVHQPSFSALAATLARDLAQVSPETEVRLHQVELGDAWDFESVYSALRDLAQAYPFAPEREDYLVHITTGTHVAQICLFLLVEARYIPARLLQTAPPDRGDRSDRSGGGSYRIIDLDLSRYDSLARRFASERNAGLSFLKAGIATRNPAFNALIERIEHVAIASPAPLLLTGPTGAGKTQLARRIFELKQQRRQVAGRLVEVNCATLRGDGAMSALFGHQRGAFTGATGDRQGLLRAAHHGVLFLDEIGELGLDEQAMLLRAIEDRRFLPVGADREVDSQFQLIAGTNRDLALAVADGHFRDDLLARINLWTFRLPSLAERIEDLAPNLEYELERASVQLGRRITMNREARERFLAVGSDPASRWSGNFRDLNAAVTRMATLAPGGRIALAEVEEELARLQATWAPTRRELAGSSAGLTQLTAGPLDPVATAADDDRQLLQQLLGSDRFTALDDFDRLQLAAVVRVCQRTRSLAAAGRQLFGHSRTLRKSVNDADRVRKYLLRFGIGLADLERIAPGQV